MFPPRDLKVKMLLSFPELQVTCKMELGTGVCAPKAPSQSRVQVMERVAEANMNCLKSFFNAMCIV